MTFFTAKYRHTGNSPAKSGFTLLIALWLLFFTVLSHLLPNRAISAMPREYEVKTALIYSIIKFVDWPDSIKTKNNLPINIGVLGQDPFKKDLDLIHGKTVKGRPIIVRRLHKIEEIKTCEVLFISSSEKHQLSHILKQLRTLPVLTIADQSGFAQAGGMINFIIKQNKVHFEINNSAVLRSQLRIRSQLLKLAEIVSE